jgi:hypothetical protein
MRVYKHKTMLQAKLRNGVGDWGKLEKKIERWGGIRTQEDGNLDWVFYKS